MRNDLQRRVAFWREEDGAVGGGGLAFIVVSLIIAGLAIDVSNLINQRSHLQLTADTAAHTALYVRNDELITTPDDAKAEAVAISNMNMPDTTYGDVLDAGDIQFGIWNAASRTFSADPASRTAVRVQTHRDEDGDNEVATFLLKLAGFDSWDVQATAVFETYEPPCLREGFVAEDLVDIQSNNSYFNGFCLHSNDVVSINSNNYFEAGTVVSMPDISDLELPNSGYKTNEGLAEALRYGAMQIRLINALSEVSSSPWSVGKADMWDFLQKATRDGQLTDITGTPRTITIVNGKPRQSSGDANEVEASKNLLDRNDKSALRSNAVNYVYCSSTSTQLAITTIIQNAVIITNCKVNFGSGGAIENALLATTSTSETSISGSSSARIGKVDDCSAGGGAQLVSLGGMDFAAGVSIHGGQLIGLKEIEFAANGEGLKGVSIISGDTVSGTSNMEMGLCGTGMGDNLSMDYFRMVL
jgi:hypothetical protein